MTSDDATAAPDEPTDSSSWSAGRIAAVMTVLAMILFWLWIWSGAPAKDNPDKLQDKAYVATLEKRCTAMKKAVDALPDAQTTPDHVDRAAVIVQANEILTDFVADVRADAPTTGDAGKTMRGLLHDWDTYISNREDYARALRDDPKARLLLDESKLGDSVDKTILIFSQVNYLPDCATPGDVI